MSQAALKQDTQDRIISTSPGNGYAVLGEVDVSSPAEIKEKVALARKAQQSWEDMGLEKRMACLRELIPLFEKNKGEFVKRTSEEMGMPHGLSTNLVDGAIEQLTWNLENATKYLATETLHEDDAEITEMTYEPRGVMACIVAWNFPLPNFVWSASQGLLAGNTIVMKYSEEVPLFCKFLETIIAQTSIPKGVVNFIYGSGKTGDALLDEKLDFVSFTGSSQTGGHIYKRAAESFTPVALELGGSSPGIVFEDCEITDELVEAIFWQRFLNSGQFCDGLKRLIVHKSHHDELVKKLVDFAKARKVGNPLNTETELGPLVAERQVLKMEEQIKDAIKKGAKIVCGGQKPTGLSGAYYEPTIITNVTRDMRVWSEEVFGPALAVVTFETYEEAIELGNDTPYGLSGFIYTNSKETEKKALRDIQAGSLTTLGAHYYRPQNPFGGYKASGIGRQGGKIGFHETCQIKVTSRKK
ncbi:MAG: aldehyde dehydrogenase family protein [Alphaproteobacteria bacterium]|nr:aldehyde dehydrogenase family protein [Alphaproteobacteria bacterium]